MVKSKLKKNRIDSTIIAATISIVVLLFGCERNRAYDFKMDVKKTIVAGEVLYESSN